jgi:hypothetical protein
MVSFASQLSSSKACTPAKLSLVLFAEGFAGLQQWRGENFPGMIVIRIEILLGTSFQSLES